MASKKRRFSSEWLLLCIIMGAIATMSLFAVTEHSMYKDYIIRMGNSDTLTIRVHRSSHYANKTARMGGKVTIHGLVYRIPPIGEEHPKILEPLH